MGYYRRPYYYRRRKANLWGLLLVLIILFLINAETRPLAGMICVAWCGWKIYKMFRDKQSKEQDSKQRQELRTEIEKTPRYKRWHTEILRRSGGKCEHCGKSDDLHVHHINSFDSIIKENNIVTTLEAVECKELWNFNNGIALCKDCHEKTSSYQFRQSKQEEELPKS